MKDFKITGVILSIARTLVSILRGFIIIYIITNVLSEAAYGRWAAIYAVITVVSTIGSLHLEGAMIRYSGGEMNSDQVFSDVLSISILTSTIIILPASIIFSIAFTSLSSFAAIISFISVTEITFKILLNKLRSDNKIELFEAFYILKTLIEICLIAIIVAVYTNIRIALLFIGIINSFFSLFLIWYNIDDLKFPQLSNFEKYLRYSIPMIPRDASGQIIANSDKFIILFYLSPVALGTYTVIYTLSAILQHLTTILRPTMYPLVTTYWDDNKREELNEIYTLVYKFLIALSVPSVIGLIIISNDIIGVTSTESIAKRSQYLVAILGIGFVFKSFRSPLEFIINSLEKNKVLAKIIFYSAAVNLLLNIIVIKYLGIIGAGISTFTSQIFMTFLVWKKTSGYIDIDIRVDSVVSVIIGSTVMGIGVIILKSNDPLWNILVLPAVGIILYVTTLMIIDRRFLIELYDEIIVRLVNDIL